MTKLSPAAEAVLDSALPHMVHRYSVAAALRAAAEIAVPHEDAMPVNLAHRVRWDARQSVRRQLLAIAAELEGDD